MSQMFGVRDRWVYCCGCFLWPNNVEDSQKLRAKACKAKVKAFHVGPLLAWLSEHPQHCGPVLSATCVIGHIHVNATAARCSDCQKCCGWARHGSVTS
eukprot:4343667-Amphidinium_carterae.1